MRRTREEASSRELASSLLTAKTAVVIEPMGLVADSERNRVRHRHSKGIRAGIDSTYLVASLSTN